MSRFSACVVGSIFLLFPTKPKKEEIMKKILCKVFLALCVATTAFAQHPMWINVSGMRSKTDNHSATSRDANASGSWSAFRKDVEVKSVPNTAIARIAVDSKYWLWINGKLVVFEGGLKRGPNPKDTYCDEIDIAPFLKRGKNQIAVLVWFFGKDGFSHLSSGKMGLFFDVDVDGLKIISDNSWLGRVHPAYSASNNPAPNFRLSESNIKFDANKDIADWQTSSPDKLIRDYGFAHTHFLGFEGCSPWGNLVKRPIPQWKDWGVKEVAFTRKPQTDIDLIRTINREKIIPLKRENTTGDNSLDREIVEATLPYNMQMTPIITLVDNRGGSLIDITTDHSFDANTYNLRAEYVTKKGEQTYESFGWLNGQKIILNLPKHVEIKSIKYRETGYDCDFAGSFNCDSDFYNLYWKKGLRTLYVNMRDTFFDCPERERSQWWGDAVQLIAESFYTLSPSSHAIMRKAMFELVNWQKPNGSLHSPIPGIYTSELPSQMLASIGKFGFWNYYMNTGDVETIKHVYPAVKKYLALWSLDENGLTNFRKGGWTWGDWGYNKDVRLIFAGWHILALEAAANMAEVLNIPEDAKAFRALNSRAKEGFAKTWNGEAYRSPDYKGATDDRVQALAVLAGVADKTKYPELMKTFKTQFWSSPYMEKYLMEALFIMGKADYALARTQMRFDKMVRDENHSTLWESWEIGGFGGGSTNHAWSAGAITVLAQYLCGIYPIEAGWKVFKIEPYPSLMKKAEISIPSIVGNVKSAFEVGKNGAFTMSISVPKSSVAMLYLPEFTNGKALTVNGNKDVSKFAPKKYQHSTKRTLQLNEGEYKIELK